MARIGLIDVDYTGYPNLALMKIAGYHERIGDDVEWYTHFEHFDKVYISKIFSFTSDWLEYINADEIERGGSGYDIGKRLDDRIDWSVPLYRIYNVPDDTAYGFLTRGCPNRCKWCIVPKKEGNISPYMDIEEIAVDGRDRIILMDNNVLASDYGLQQIEKIVRMGIRVDFNQGLDARLVDEGIAKLLAAVRWIKNIRFGCDTEAQIRECEKAVSLIDKYGYKGEYFFYCILLDDINEAYRRVSHWRLRGRRFIPHVQPYRNPDLNNKIPQWQKDMAHWADRKEIFFSCDFKDFEPRKRFKCKNYF